MLFIMKISEQDGELKVTSKKWISHMKEKGLNKEKMIEQYPWIDADEIQEDLFSH